MKIRIRIALAACAAALMAASAAEYPERPVTFIVPFPPGDAEDILTRFIAEDLQDAYGAAAAVVNKPGGGGGPFPGAAEVARADADGYTIGSFVIGIPLIAHQIGMEEFKEDTFEPLGIFLTYPFIIAAGADAPYDDVQGLARHAKTNKVSLGHFGPPLIPTQVAFAMAKKLGFEFASDAAFDGIDCNVLASGDADVVTTTIPQVLPCLDRIKVLASVTGERIPQVAQVPTVGEIDSDLDISLWNGLFVRKETPQDVRDRIAAVAEKTMSSARARKYADETGTAVYWLNAAEAKRQIAKDKRTNAGIGQLVGQ